MKRAPLVMLIAALALAGGRGADAQQWTLRLELRGRRVEGRPLAWSRDSIQLLARDGRLWDFAPEEASNYVKAADGFRSYSQGEIRGQLMQEFGRRFEVSGTGNYLVVHPAGERVRWADRFEQLYRSFVHYFTTRGLRPARPVFPLVAVVFHNKTEYLRHCAKIGMHGMANSLGFYEFESNRIFLFDIGGPKGSEDDWRVNAETIIHEAAHQSAFNTGVHNRFAPPPRWVIEGLGMMFEARGVYDSRHYRHLQERINRGQLQAFRQWAQRRPAGFLAQYVSSDRTFELNAAVAYAEAWALTFYLAEKEPGKYVDLLRTTAERENFTSYRSPERVRDFTALFGSDLKMLEARMLRFIGSLK